MPTGQAIKMDEEFVESQGEMVELLNADRARATWYRPDGLAIPNLPTDMYHRNLYKAKGWTLLDPGTKTTSKAEALTKKEHGGEEWQMPIAVSANNESPSEKLVEEPVAPPPKHIHVMLAGIGAPCLVQGCSHVRKAELVGIKKTARREKRAVKETTNA